MKSSHTNIDFAGVGRGGGGGGGEKKNIPQNWTQCPIVIMIFFLFFWGGGRF